MSSHINYQSAVSGPHSNNCMEMLGQNRPMHYNCDDVLR